MDRPAPRPASHLQGAVAVAVALVLTAGLCWYSQTFAGFVDEGFHLMAAKRVLAGQRPYADFFHQQMPLYPLLLGAWLALWGETWRNAHLLSALCAGASLGLVALWTWTRRESGWRRTAAAAGSACLVGANAQVILFGTIAQPYAVCLLLAVGAFWFAAESRRRDRSALALAAGACAGAAAGCSLLAAPVIPALLWWLHHTRERQATRRGTSRHLPLFVAGAALPFVPLAWLAVQAPQQAWFGVLGCHIRERWRFFQSPVLFHIRMLVKWWIETPQTLVLLGLSSLGLLHHLRGREVSPLRSEIELGAALAGALALGLLLVVPVFPQYFVLLIPFLAMIAPFGLEAVASQIAPGVRSGVCLVPVLLVYVLGAAEPLWRPVHSPRYWPSLDAVARDVAEVTPPEGRVLADEQVYFAGGRLAPEGLGNEHGSALRLSRREAALLHVLTQEDIAARVEQGAFDTVVVLADGDSRRESYQLPRRYAHHRVVGAYEIFWGRAESPADARPAPGGGG